MGNDEEVVREYPLQHVRSGKKLEASSLVVTNKRLIYKRTVKNKKDTSHEVKNIPISSVDTISSTLAFKKKRSVILTILSLIMILSGAFLMIDALRALVKIEWPEYSMYIGIGVLAAGVLLLLLVLIFAKRRYYFSLSVGYLSEHRESAHIVSGLSSITACKVKKSKKKKKERFRVNLDYEKLDDLVTELGALVVRFKNA
jgi:hypothetical protein